MITVSFLGTNGWFDSRTGNTVCVLVDTPECNLVLDAGFGLCKLDQCADLSKPTVLLLSHLHLDHVVGLHALAKFAFTRPLTVVVPRVYVRPLRNFLAQPWTMPINKLPFPLQIQPIVKNFRAPGVRITALPLVHAAPCWGYRLDCGEFTVSYCTDTGPCDNIVRLAQRADLLITECALEIGGDDHGWPHLDPQVAARLAAQSGVGQLVLTHFDAFVYRSVAQRRTAQAQARKIFRACRVATDGMQLRF